MLGPADILLGGVLPGAVALVVRQGLLRAGVSDRVVWPLAVGVAFVAGQAALAAQPGATGGEGFSAAFAGWASALPRATASFAWPRESSQWLPAATAGAAVISLFITAGGYGRPVGAALGVALAVGLPLRLLWGSVYLTSEWSGGEAAAWSTGLAATLLAVGWLLSRPQSEASAASDWLRAALTAAAALGLAIVLATSGSLSYARLAGIVVAAIVGAQLGGVGVAADRRRGVETAGPVLASLAGGLLLLGYFFAEVTAVNTLLLAGALAATGLPLPKRLATGWRPIALRGAVCLALVAVAAGNAGYAFAEATAAETSNPYANWPAE
ncbi:hypothetical protein Pla108_10350 [Botrimarina colliarenosi]|uniref:Uncharacterized protein n=1 Tax=Botrimarina colliarenosi TaxID=2528001 RepID=A0A5C6AL13_9BACT|nr:hypothetical protein [Botrimarina colliarenosi]TWU00091.1 hypothetical protein Pla108_10350 [Botrimarina colliarenosi]